MEFRYAPPGDFPINYEPLKALIRRHEFAESELGRQFLSEDNPFPDKKTIAIIRPPGCMRGIRNSGVWLSLDDYMHHDIDVAVSVGAVEQVQLGNAAAGIDLYWTENFIRLGHRDIFKLMKIASYEVARHVSSSIKPPINMSQMRAAMDANWSNEFTRHRAKKITVVTRASDNEALEFDLDAEMRQHGKKRVLDIVMASAHLPGAAGPSPLLEVEGKKIDVHDGYFSKHGPLPFDAALRAGATDIIIPLSISDYEAVRMDAGQRRMFMHFMKAHNPKADEVHERGVVRNEIYLSQIREKGEIRDEDGRTARVMAIPLSVDEMPISATETDRGILKDTLRRGITTGNAVMKTALDQLAAGRPAKVRGEPAAAAVAKTLIAA